MKVFFFKATCIFLLFAQMAVYAIHIDDTHNYSANSSNRECDNVVDAVPTTDASHDTASYHEHCCLVCHGHSCAAIAFQTIMPNTPTHRELKQSYLYSSSTYVFHLLSIFRPPIV